MSGRTSAVSRRAVLTAGGSGLLAGCFGRSSTETLTVGILPDVDPETAIEQNRPLAEHLEDDLDVEIDLETTADYASLVQGMTSEQVDIAYFGGVSYVLASQRADVRAIAVGEQDGVTEWESVFIATQGNGIDTASALTEASDIDFVLGDPISTTGSVMPTYYADRELEMDLETAFDSVTHLGAHDAILRTVGNGDADAGALNGRIFDFERERGNTADADEIWRTPRFPNYPWAVGPTVSEQRADAVQQSFLTLHEAVSDDLLDSLNVDRYVESTHDEFTDLEAAVDHMGLSESDEP